MKLEKGKTYLIKWASGIKEWTVLEESVTSVRGTGDPSSKGNGSWYERKQIEPLALEELKRG
jgi:hypothetical protein